MRTILAGFLILATGAAAMLRRPESPIPARLLREITAISGAEAPRLSDLPLSVRISGPNPTGKFMLAENTSPVRYVYIGRVNTCRAGGCDAPARDADATGRSEFFEYYILYDESGKILLTRVFNYEATHGQEITVKGWLRQFAGYGGRGDLTVGKEIDAIAGATISVYGITADVVARTRGLREYLDSRHGPE